MEHEKTIKFWGTAAGILGALSVALGAFASHSLADVLAPARLSTFQTGISYMQFHVVAIFLAVMLMWQAGSHLWLRRAAALHATGIVLFTGSLTILSTTGVTWFGAVAPLGGLAFIAGWLSLVVHFRKRQP